MARSNLLFISHLYLLHLVNLVSGLDSLGFYYIQAPIMQSSLIKPNGIQPWTQEHNVMPNLIPNVLPTRANYIGRH